MTETLMNTSVRADGERKPGSVGVPLAGVGLRLVDEAGAEVSEPGTVGEIQVRGPNLFTEYLNRPDATAAALDGGWFRTGDMATRDPDGYVRIVGRKATDLIKSGGYKIGAGEIENALLEHPNVAEVAVTGEPDDDLGERIVAWVVPDGARPTVEELMRPRVEAARPAQAPARRAIPGCLAAQRHGQSHEASAGMRTTARELLSGLSAGFTDLPVADTPADDPLGWPGYPEARAAAAARTGETESVVVGEAKIGDVPTVLIAWEFGFLGGSIGQQTGDRVEAAFAHAKERGLPVVSLVATGGSRMQHGMRALSQLHRIARAAAEARAAGVPQISVLRDPSTGGGWATLGAGSDVVLGLPDAQVGFMRLPRTACDVSGRGVHRRSEARVGSGRPSR